jgi:hypothetical protein
MMMMYKNSTYRGLNNIMSSCLHLNAVGSLNSPYRGLDNTMSRCLHLNVVGGFVYGDGTESYTIGSLATGTASLAGQVRQVGI